MKLLFMFRGAVGGIRWYLRELTGEAEYDRYSDRHRRTHPLVPAMSRREFERQRIDRREQHPGDRCC
jgi:uncharacterized short protein YbdD (DUF466 family)